MRKTTNKIVLIGSGQVGVGFLWSAISQGLASEYSIIDLNEGVAKGNVYDFQDAIATQTWDYKVEAASYESVKDADLVVITAGRPQKLGETRLEMVADNAKIMKNIAESVKSNGFKGVTVIASNPVDIMASIYKEVTGFDSKKVISSGCVLDSARLKNALSQIFGHNRKDIIAYVMGEHGDSSISTFENATIAGIPLKSSYEEKGLTKQKLDELHESVWKRAYKIIEGKGYTNFGIGSALCKISRSILRDEKLILPVGVFLTGEYNHTGVHASIPATVGAGGIIDTHEFPLSDKEKKDFDKSVSILKDNLKVALDAIN